MTKSTCPYTLYELVPRVADALELENVSPHVWKTKIDLAVLGVEHTRDPLTFPQINGDLSSTTGTPNVTVPTLKVGEDEYVTDSWVIAEWLESKYGSAEKSLFPSPEAKSFAKFLEIWANNDLANEIRPLFGPILYTLKDDAAKAYFLKNKAGGDSAKLEAAVVRASDPSFIETQSAAARGKLGTLESHLAALNKSGTGPFIAGTAHPTHADAVVFGWYASAQVNKAAGPKIWKHETLPRVGEWVDAVVAATGVNPAY